MRGSAPSYLIPHLYRISLVVPVRRVARSKCNQERADVSRRVPLPCCDVNAASTPLCCGVILPTALVCIASGEPEARCIPLITYHTCIHMYMYMHMGGAPPPTRMPNPLR